MTVVKRRDGPAQRVYIEGSEPGSVSVAVVPPLVPTVSITPEFDIITGGATWTKSAGTRGFTAVVVEGADAGNPVKITTASGLKPDITWVGYSASWGVDGEASDLDGGAFSIQAMGTAKVAINWTE